MKKWSVLLLAAILFCLSFTGAASAKAAAVTTVTEIYKESVLGSVSIMTDRATTVQAVQKSLSIAGVKVVWKANTYHKDGKAYNGTFSAKLKKTYVIKASGSFKLGKGAQAQIRWDAMPIQVKNFVFMSEPGQFGFTTAAKASLADMQGKIKAFVPTDVKHAHPLAVKVTARTDAPNAYKAVISGAEGGVKYIIVFSDPFPNMTMPFQWEKPMPTLTAITIDNAKGTISLSFSGPVKLTLSDLVIQAYMNGEPVQLENLAYAGGVLTYKPLDPSADGASNNLVVDIFAASPLFMNEGVRGEAQF